MPISDILAQITGEKQSTVPLPGPVPKRKADGDLQRVSGKSVRRDQPAANTITSVTQITKSTNIQSVSANSRLSNPAFSNARTDPSASNGNRGATTSLTQPAKEPKKGSYAEILARAKAAQATLGMVGKIQHKAIEKGLSKRERQELKKDQASKSYRISKRASPSGVRISAGDGRNGAREKAGKVFSKVKASQIPEKRIKKAALATTGYTGTARPNPASAKSVKPTKSSCTAEKAGHGRSSSGRGNAYASEDDGDDVEEEEEDEEDYDSDISSDMEADVFEVDEEEEKAARIARREDEEALREEVRHQREKEEKRRRLANMAKSRR